MMRPVHVLLLTLAAWWLLRQPEASAEPSLVPTADILRERIWPEAEPGPISTADILRPVG